MKLKYKILCSEWFEALTEEQQRDYIKEHPDSKYAHKVGKSKPDKKVLKDYKKIDEHLKGEGINTDSNFFNLKPEHIKKLHTVADKAGKRVSSTSDKTAGRALYEKLPKSTPEEKVQKLKEKILNYDEKIQELNELLENAPDEAKVKIYNKLDEIKDRREGLRERISEIINNQD